jgi:hypothetical protein
MVGGVVIETIVLPEKVWVNCREKPRRGRKCAIYVERTPESRSISEGDSLWWQGEWAMWTPKNHAFEDKKLRRVGFSGVNRPNEETADVR